jgi:hypothetical protein
VGGATSVSIPARSNSASLRASRRSVLIALPGFTGINDGAITWQAMPARSICRFST